MGLGSVNWQALWNQHLPIPCRLLSLNQLYQQLNNIKNTSLLSSQFINANSQPIEFIPQSQLPDGTAYEEHIFSTGKIPTRDNLHDYFNACIWFTFLKTKILLNQLQFQVIQTDGIQSSRGKIRDALTLFDENGAVLVTCNNEIDDAINSFSWKKAFIEHRDDWNASYKQNSQAQAEVYVFGHALLEQLVEPRKPLCAHAITIKVDQEWFAQTPEEKIKTLDALMYQQFIHTSSDLNTRSFQPLPVLGIPHFWQENENPSFYEDEFVFRSGRRKRK